MPEEEYTVPILAADVKSQGGDVTVVAISKMVGEALQAAKELAGEGTSVEVVDPRTLVPAVRCACIPTWVKLSINASSCLPLADSNSLTRSAARCCNSWASRSNGPTILSRYPRAPFLLPPLHSLPKNGVQKLKK